MIASTGRAKVEYTTYRWLKNEDFTAFGHHYGGNLLKWAEEEAGIFAVRQLGNFAVATVVISNITFPNPLGKQEDILKLDVLSAHFGASSLRFGVSVTSATTKTPILEIGQITFVKLSDNGKSTPHGYTSTTDLDDRFNASGPIFP